MKVLVINSGSSSIKYRLLCMPEGDVLTAGAIERIGEANGDNPVADHRAGLSRMVDQLCGSGQLQDLSELAAIGHRVVHGGELFRQPARINDEVMTQIRDMIPLAPLHNPANLLGIEVSIDLAPQVPQVAVFDTAFHQDLPEFAWRYALPGHLYSEYRVRRYGFHGTSHAFVAARAADYLQRPIDDLNLITLHLGNGASAAAIAGGRSVDTSMGMTPMEGLIMGTRCGDIDPAIHFYLQRETWMDKDALEAMFNRDSGLRGICGANDMREVHHLADDGDRDARLALQMYCYRIRKYVGAYTAVLGRVDALVFTGGIGEHDARVRAHSCAGLDCMGIVLDEQRNAQDAAGARAIHADASVVAVLVIPTDEELEIARQAVACLAGA